MTDQQKIFNEVVEWNIEMLKSHISRQAQTYSILELNNTLDEKQTRQKAVDFFYHKLATLLEIHLNI